ncbi:cytochrome P450 [Aspergillus affinis]|uniref:cytochrome P450 n=1 Tax=Aspergillus affinis TaxID=1070780 RepID=UPI0022FDBFBD|nr:cytochrome P450 [Aspergillus affinis]KAI9035511.1 cytochrome P450 [Aspergillus affinis]
MLTKVLYDLCGRDELITALCDETRSVVQREGLTVSALQNLHLMDSTLKESQRLKPSLADPDRFDAYRSVRLRQTAGKERYAQVTTPSPEHLAWGFGKHACPGRNLVVTEIKIALVHILLKYDLQLVDGLRPQPVKNGIVMSANSTAAVWVRRRQDDVSLSL